MNVKARTTSRQTVIVTMKRTLAVGRRILVILTLVIPFELVVSAGVMEMQRKRAEAATIEAEVAQEPYQGSDWGRAYWKEIDSYRETWSPYIVYRVADRHGQFIKVKDGVRETYQPTGIAGVRRPEVFMFGGSAAWGHGARDLETIPSWLSRTAEQHGQAWDVRNYAESGWVNWQGISYLLQKLADGERPDTVIFYSGVNEVLGARQWPNIRRPIFDGDLYSDAMRERTLQIHRPLQRLWDYYRYTSFTARTLSSPQHPATSVASSPELARRIATEYLADKSVVEALGRQYGFKTFFVWQVTVAAKPKLSAQERRYAGWLPPSRETTPALAWWSMPDELRELYVAVGRELISRSNVIDLSDAFESISETSFIDWMHLSEFGNMCLSRALYDKLK